MCLLRKCRKLLLVCHCLWTLCTWMSSSFLNGGEILNIFKNILKKVGLSYFEFHFLRKYDRSETKMSITYLLILSTFRSSSCPYKVLDSQIVKVTLHFRIISDFTFCLRLKKTWGPSEKRTRYYRATFIYVAGILSNCHKEHTGRWTTKK